LYYEEKLNPESPSVPFFSIPTTCVRVFRAILIVGIGHFILQIILLP